MAIMGNLTALVGRDSFLSARSADFGPFSSFFWCI
jgi:hypothetical protein